MSPLCAALSLEQLRVSDSPLKREFMAQPRIALLFTNIEQIVTLNEDLLQRLSERLPQMPDGSECVGDIFAEFGPLFAIYAQYTANHELAVQALKKLEGRVAYAETMRACETKCAAFLSSLQECSPPPLNAIGSYLILPVQRVPRYRMLLQELRKRTDDSHEDVSSIDMAIEKISISATKINETIRQREQQEELVRLEGKFSSRSRIALAKTGRSLVRYGFLTKVCRKDLRQYYFHLCSDLLLYSKSAMVRMGHSSCTDKFH